MATSMQRTRDLNGFDWAAIILTVIGAINWGLVGLFSFDLVAFVFGPMSVLSRIVYVLVALAGIYVLAAASTRFRSAARPTDVTGAAPSAPRA